MSRDARQRGSVSFRRHSASYGNLRSRSSWSKLLLLVSCIDAGDASSGCSPPLNSSWPVLSPLLEPHSPSTNLKINILALPSFAVPSDVYFASEAKRDFSFFASYKDLDVSAFNLDYLENKWPAYAQKGMFLNSFNVWMKYIGGARNAWAVRTVKSLVTLEDILDLWIPPLSFKGSSICISSMVPRNLSFCN